MSGVMAEWWAGQSRTLMRCVPYEDGVSVCLRSRRLQDANSL